MATALASLAQGGKPSSGCSSVPLVWTIHSTLTDGSPAAILGDNSNGDTTYTDGVDKVAVTGWCSAINAARTAQVDMGTSKRSLVYRFPSPLEWFGTPLPGWIPGPLQTKGFVQIFDFDFVPSGMNRATDTYTFKTWLHANFPSPSGRVGFNAYSLRMVAWDPAPDDPALIAGSPGSANSPLMTSIVQVTHIPASQSGTGKETWLVWPLPASGSTGTVSTLMDISVTPQIPLGQFAMPFYFTIRLK